MVFVVKLWLYKCNQYAKKTWLLHFYYNKIMVNFHKGMLNITKHVSNVLKHAKDMLKLCKYASNLLKHNSNVLKHASNTYFLWVKPSKFKLLKLF